VKGEQDVRTLDVLVNPARSVEILIAVNLKELKLFIYKQNSWDLYYKTLYCRNFRIFIIS
jgi:hypothetical protein